MKAGFELGRGDLEFVKAESLWTQGEFVKAGLVFVKAGLEFVKAKRIPGTGREFTEGIESWEKQVSSLWNQVSSL